MTYVVNAVVSDTVLTNLRKSMRFSDDEVKNNEEALILFGVALAKEDGFDHQDTEVRSVNVSHWDDSATRLEFGPQQSARTLSEENDG